MRKRTILILATSYALVTFILYHVLDSTVGGILATISQLAFAIGVLAVIYAIIKLFIDYRKQAHHSK